MMQMNDCGAKCVVYSDTDGNMLNKFELKQIKPFDSHNIKKGCTSQYTGLNDQYQVYKILDYITKSQAS